MITLTEGAFAKLNLTLDVLERREDGFHNLRSVMQTVSLRDDVQINLDTGKPWRIVCSTEGIPCDETNLAWKAARVYFDALGTAPDGLEIRINKRIPSGAGLAGGSADAGAVLRALNRYYGAPLPTDALCALGAQVGSDVPFCVLCGTVLAEGKGERLNKLPDAPELFYVICKPEFSLSTAELYQKLDCITVRRRPDADAMCLALRNGDLEGIGRNLSNVFEEAVLPEHPEIGRIKSALLSCGACGAQMTGSGSAVFGIFASLAGAKAASAMLKENEFRVFVAKNVSH